MNSKTKLLILAMAVTAAGLLTCSGPSAPDLAEPEYNNPYDERGNAYIPTPDLNTVPVTGIRVLEAVSGGEFETDYGKQVTAKGVCWSTEEVPTLEDDCTNDGHGLDAFTSIMTGLQYDQVYYVRAYATNEDSTGYGGQRSFKTLDGRPELYTNEAHEIRARSARVSGEVHGDGGVNLIRWGVCYSENAQPTTSDTCLDAEESASQKSTFGGLQWNPENTFEANRSISQNSGNAINNDNNKQVDPFSSNNFGHGVDFKPSMHHETETVTKHSHRMDHKGKTAETDQRSFNIMLEELSPGHRYNVRTFAINEARTSYGPQIQFTTRDGMAVVATTGPFDVTAFTAKTGGQITDDGGAEVIGRGVCWALTENPTLEDTCEPSGTGMGSFEVGLSNFEPDRTYYVRAYGTTGVGTSYGTQHSFITTEGLAIVTTAVPSQIRAFSAHAGGQVSDQGDAAVTDRGVCYSNEEQPTTGDSCVSSGEREGLFEVGLRNLEPDRTYYVRAYAVNQAGTAYGGQESFTTREGIAVVATTEPFEVRAFSAKTGGQITDDGGAEVIGRGVCWALTENPTLEDIYQPSGTGTGSFEVELSDLGPERTYYVRAYGTTDVGTTYGAQKSFITTDGMAIVTTAVPSQVRAFSAYAGGQVSDQGDAAITDRGVCYSTLEQPTTANLCVTSEGGEGSFEVLIDELEPDQTYYVRAYVVNQAGTAYGGQESFNTRDGITVVATTEPFDIRLTSAKTGGQITDDGGAEVTSRGVCFIDGSGEPDLSDTCVESGTGTGSFEVLLEDLSPDRQYTVRASATNAVGTQFGNEVSFTTPSGRDTETEVVEVTNPATGRTWMDRNLGASRVATSSTDTQAYGDLYQWGRAADGHKKRNTPTTYTLSSTDVPGHDSFILAPDDPSDWRSPQNDNLWQGVNGINNPCPVGYRLPTLTEWEAERQSWSSDGTEGAFNSPLKLPLAGFRDISSGSLYSVGSIGYYWSSSVSGTGARSLYIVGSSAFMRNDFRAFGVAVRCIKD